jgi:hypothetical protein
MTLSEWILENLQLLTILKQGQLGIMYPSQKDISTYSPAVVPNLGLMKPLDQVDKS